MNDEENDRHESEYQELLALFIAFLKNINSDTRDEALFALAELRADLAIRYALDGFGMDIDEALQLLKNLSDDNLTKQDRDKRDRIIAAVNNLIEFAVCEEYQLAERATQMYDERKQIALPDEDGDEEEEYDIDWNNPDEVAEYYDLCALYNDTYAAVENGDIQYAMAIAYKWIQLAEEQYLTYWTMEDNKVRPWHLALQGYTAKRDDFPAWMIPPIEWNCRCFLITATGEEIMGKSGDIRRVVGKVPQKPSQISDVFCESVAKCGRIFSDAHPYFQVKESDKEMLGEFVNRIKSKYYA